MNLITIKQAAELLGVHPNTIRNWIADGRLQVERIGTRIIRIDKNQLNKLFTRKGYQDEHQTKW